MGEDGALEPLSPEVAQDLPGRIRGFVWPTEFLMLADFLEATPHSHSALQLMVGIETPIRMDFGDGSPPSVERLSGIAHLSESRLQHLFREQVGVPIRRYLLWHRVLAAIGEMADGATATDAAHAAGFADSAHLSRTTRRMNGVTPSEMGPIGAWLSNCR